MSVRWYLHKLAMMFGAEPRRPTKKEETEAAREMKLFQKTPEETKKRREAIKQELEYPVVSNKWRYLRWTSILLINTMFIVSFSWDVQLVEGALTASRFLGFHMADPTAAIQVTLAYKNLMLNLLIGTVTVILVWWFFGGRAFCSWACPYHLLAEWAESIHLFLANGCDKLLYEEESDDIEEQRVVRLSREKLLQNLRHGAFREVKWAANVALALLQVP